MKKICLLRSSCDSHRQEFRKLRKNLEGVYDFTIYPQEADIIISFMCAASAVQLHDAAVDLLYVKNVKKAGATFIVAGCIVDALGKELLLSFTHIDYAFTRANFVQDILDLLTQKKAINDYGFEPSESRFHIDIVQGCARKGGWCNFCKQHYMKVPVCSLPIPEVINRIKEVTSKSNISIVQLDGLNTCNYGIDIDDHKPKLHLLIQEISKIPEIRLIDVSSVTVGDIYDELAEELANNPKVHLIEMGIQSGSDKMLEAMNIHSTSAQIQHYLDKFAHKALHTIVVIGHPGETMETVNETIAMIKRNNLWHVHVNQLISTVGTPSSKIPALPRDEFNSYFNKVCKEVSRMREDFLKSAKETMTDAYFEKYTYYEDDDTLSIDAIPAHFYASRFCFFVKKASSSKYYDLVKNLRGGDKIKVHISEFIDDETQDNTAHVRLCFDRLEVVEIE